MESIRIVKANGTIEEIHRSHEVFPGVVVSLGLLGVISAVTFRCVPSFALQSLSSVRDVQDVLDNFDELHRGNLYTDMLYFPSIDQIAILSVNKVEKEQCKLSAYKPVETVKRPQQLGHAKLKRQLTIMSLRAGAWLVQRSDALQRYQQSSRPKLLTSLVQTAVIWCSLSVNAAIPAGRLGLFGTWKLPFRMNMRAQ